MPVEPVLKDIEQDIQDVAKTEFDYVSTIDVPRQSDPQLTYEIGKKKVGKKIETCVLYVDIRNSVELTEKHHTQTMGRIYSAFTKGILKVARHHSGHIRNIIGDRIMIVFPVANCFTNAIDCAISINHIASKIISVAFPGVDFKCGIGIDFGELRVIKVGTQRRGHEHPENRGLVWAGYPANIASRLTDVANKTFDETLYKVTYNPINPIHLPGMMSLSSIFGYKEPKNEEPYYLNKIEEKTMSEIEFARSISSVTPGELYLIGGKFIKMEKVKRKTVFKEILITEEVYKGFKNDNPSRANSWTVQEGEIKNVYSKIYGASLIWKLS